MPHTASIVSRRAHQVRARPAKQRSNKADVRYTVALAPALVRELEKYANTAEMSMSKAIARLVRLGLECQEDRKREFFHRLRENLANDDPRQQDRLLEEFRSLILGR